MEYSDPRILLLSGDEQTRATFRELLHPHWTPQETIKVADAVTLVSSHSYDVLILDVDTPGELDEVLAATDGSKTRPVVLAIAPRDHGEAMLEHVETGAVYRFVLKPFPAGQARLAVDAALRRHTDGTDDVPPLQASSEHKATRSGRSALLAGGTAAALMIGIGGYLLMAAGEPADSPEATVSAPAAGGTIERAPIAAGIRSVTQTTAGPADATQVASIALTQEAQSGLSPADPPVSMPPTGPDGVEIVPDDSEFPANPAQDANVVTDDTDTGDAASDGSGLHAAASSGDARDGNGDAAVTLAPDGLARLESPTADPAPTAVARVATGSPVPDSGAVVTDLTDVTDAAGAADAPATSGRDVAGTNFSSTSAPTFDVDDRISSRDTGSARGDANGKASARDAVFQTVDDAAQAAAPTFDVDDRFSSRDTGSARGDANGKASARDAVFQTVDDAAKAAVPNDPDNRIVSAENDAFPSPVPVVTPAPVRSGNDRTLAKIAPRLPPVDAALAAERDADSEIDADTRAILDDPTVRSPRTDGLLAAVSPIPQVPESGSATIAKLPAADADTQSAAPGPEVVSVVRTEYVAPQYPKRALQLEQQGWVDVSFLIGPDGVPQNVTVKDSHPMRSFDRAATRAVRKWRYDPVLENGQPVFHRQNVRIDFSLE